MFPAALTQAFPTSSRREDRRDGFRLDLGAHGRIEVREHRRPLASARVIFESLAAELGGASAAPVVDRLVTREGEHAAFTTLVTSRGVTYAGIVFGDDFYRLVIAGSAPASSHTLEPLTRRIVGELPLGLSYRRRRWYDYTPPPGWGCMGRHTFITEWIPPSFPNDRALISMFPARPAGESEPAALDRHLHEMGWGGYRSESVAGPERVTTASGLAGVRWHLVGSWLDRARTHTEVVLVNDYTFFYWMRLDHDGTQPTAHSARFAAVVDSVQSIPSAQLLHTSTPHLVID